VRKLGFRFVQSLLRLLTVRDVLYCAEDAPRPARLVPHYITLTMNNAHLAARPNHAILFVVARSAGDQLRRLFGHFLPIFRVDEFLHCGKLESAFLRWQPKYAVAFV
jgi:hypothetical protein